MGNILEKVKSSGHLNSVLKQMFEIKSLFTFKGSKLQKYSVQ